VSTAPRYPVLLLSADLRSYLGDALVHFSIPLVLYANGLFHPLELVGPIANLVFLRFIGGDKENESNQETRYKSTVPTKYVQLQSWREQKNAFWPNVKEIANQWTWVLIGIGAATAVVEKVVRENM